MYRDAAPHDGYGGLLSLAAGRPAGYFVLTTNVDGLFAKVSLPLPPSPSLPPSLSLSLPLSPPLSPSTLSLSPWISFPSAVFGKQMQQLETTTLIVADNKCFPSHHPRP